MPHREQRDRQRQEQRDEGGADTEQDRRATGGPEELQVPRRGREPGAAALREPADEHADRDADADCDHGGKARQHRQRPAAELVADGSPAGAVADPRVVRVAAQPRLSEQQHEAEHDREERQRGGTGGAEAEPVLGVDVQGERLEPQRDEGVELDERIERHEQQTAEQRRAELRQDDAEEDLTRIEPERARRLLERRIEPAQRDGDEQEDDRVVGERDDPCRADEPLERDAQRRPRVARDEERHRQRGDEQQRPEPPPGKPRPLDEPGCADADHAGDRRRDERHQHGVAQQRARRGCAEGVRDRGRPALEGLEGDDRDRQDDQDRDDRAHRDQARRDVASMSCDASHAHRSAPRATRTTRVGRRSSGRAAKAERRWPLSQRATASYT